MVKAKILEIFSSLQGEGLFVGAKQIFVRFAGCNLRCGYCDTDFDGRADELGVDEVLKRVLRLEKTKGRHHSVSITGGEPLLQKDFLTYLLPMLKAEGFKIYLETNGTLFDELNAVIDYVDIIAMDVKLPSATGMGPLWIEHREFLRRARAKSGKIFVKAVVTGATSVTELVKAAELVASEDKYVPFFIQPATPAGMTVRPISTDMLRQCRFSAENRLEHVRVLPQMHKILNIR